MTWDALGRMLTETAPQGTVTSEYDLAGRRTKVILPGATSLFANHDYDVLGNVTFIRENGAASGVGVLATYQYDSLSRRSSVTFGNGVVQSFSYDPVTRLASQTTDLAATANDLTQTFAYNPASQISSVTRSNDLYAWTGHTNDNLSSTANGLNQIGNVGAKTITHDSKGNITGVGTDTYGYASENFLTTGPGGAALSYDPMGRLAQVSNVSTRRMVYDGDALVEEYDGSENLQRRFVHGVGVDDPMIWYEGPTLADSRFLHADHQGSVIAVSDNAGNVSAINKYDEYGVPAAANVGRFGYTGQAWVPELNLWYYKARFMDPWRGRFLQVDPVGYESQANLYTYVANDPVNVIDPNGMEGFGCWTLPNRCGGAGASPAATGRGALTIGVGIDASVMGGGSIEGGVMLSNQGLDFYGSAAGSVGLDISLSLDITYFPESADVAGDFSSVTGGAGPVSASEIRNTSGSVIGRGISIGPSLPISATGSRGTTASTSSRTPSSPSTLHPGSSARVRNGRIESFNSLTGRWEEDERLTAMFANQSKEGCVIRLCKNPQ